MTEEQVERLVEARVNGLDSRFLASSMTQEEYAAKLRAIDRWAEILRSHATKGE